jgi:hypothetical protein
MRFRWLHALSDGCTLPDMYWKRGLLLAGLNLAAAASMITLLESRDARYVMEREKNNGQSVARGTVLVRVGLGRPTPPRLLVVQEEQAVTFTPCGGWVHYPVQVEVVRFGNMPASALAGWRLDCRPRWTLSGRILGEVEKAPNESDLPLQRLVDVGLCVLIVVQWILVGGLPVTRPQRFWCEPGAFITICSLVASGLAMIHAIEGWARLPALFAGLEWLLWFVWLICKCIWLAWRSLIKMRKTATSV